MWGIFVKSLRVASSACVSVAALLAAPAHAQNGAEPAALERTIPQPPQPSASSHSTFADPNERQAVKSGPIKRFTLGAVNIEGARAFTRSELGQDFEPLLASEVDGAKLGELAARITQRYRQRGYLLSYASIPAQRVETGMIRLAIVEGKVNRVSIAGAGADRAAIEAIAHPLIEDAPLQSKTLERVIGLIRDFPGVSVADVALDRSEGSAGLYTLKIRVTPNRFRAFSYADNRGTGSIGSLRLYSSASVSSVALDGDEMRVDLFTMPGRRFNYLNGHVLGSIPIGRDGLRLTLSASRGNQFLREAERLDGTSTNLLAQIAYPLLRSRSLTIVGKASLDDWRSTAETNNVPALRDRLRVARLGLEFSTETKARLRGEVSLSRGLGFGAMTEAGDPLASRPTGSGRFLKAAFNLQVTRPVTDKIRVQAVLAGQYSSQPLLSAEEFSLGGSRIGRAFDFNEITGDHGIGALAEISYDLGKIKGGPKAELFAYADGGGAFRRHSSPNYPAEQWLAGTGIGARLGMGRSIVSGELGLPVARSQGASGARAFVSLTRAF